MELNESSFVNEKVLSQRKLYTPSEFAKENLLYLQEVGSLKALSPHQSGRENLNSLLFFIVLDGQGSITYQHITTPLHKGNAVFIHCNQPYIHATNDPLWSIQWVHFYAHNALNLYHKYKQRGGSDVLELDNIDDYNHLLTSIYQLAISDDYLKDMHIYQHLVNLMTKLMEKSWNPMTPTNQPKFQEFLAIRSYLDTHYLDNITLDELANQFVIHKMTLIRQFKSFFGTTIGQYIQHKRLTQAKEMLRYQSESIEQIAYQCGYDDANYFIRLFKKFEGTTPYQYRKSWQNTHR